jgi:hypothetical protein
VTARRRLSNRRASTTFGIESQGLTFTVTASAFDTGELAEVFITNHRASSGAGIMASDAAIAASLALQYGCPAEVLRRALARNANGRASGPLGCALDHIMTVETFAGPAATPADVSSAANGKEEKSNEHPNQT